MNILLFLFHCWIKTWYRKFITFFTFLINLLPFSISNRIYVIVLIFSVMKATLESKRSVCLSINPLPKPLSLSGLLLLTIEPIGHQAYQPSSLLAIMLVGHWAHWPSSLSTIKPLDHWAYWPLVFFCDFRLASFHFPIYPIVAIAGWRTEGKGSSD